MKIIRKDIMRNGTKIQLEDWSDHNTPDYPDLHGLTIGAYPIAINSGAYGLVCSGQAFRLHIATNNFANYSSDDVAADYEALVNGTKSLEDLSAHFWNGDKDKWYLGMFTPGTNEWYDAQIRYQLKGGAEEK